MAMRVEGIKAVEKTLRDVSPAEGRRIARRTVTRVAREVRDKVRQRAPKDEGNLRKAIKSRRAKGSRDRAEAEIWVDKGGGPSGKGYHWHLIEFGTAKMAAQPFTVPTIQEMRPEVPKIYEREWWPQYEKEMVKRAKKQAKRSR
jgi:HK97 gp10 family phage protein